MVCLQKKTIQVSRDVLHMQKATFLALIPTRVPWHFVLRPVHSAPWKIQNLVCFLEANHRRKILKMVRKVITFIQNYWNILFILFLFSLIKVNGSHKFHPKNKGGKEESRANENCRKVHLFNMNCLGAIWKNRDYEMILLWIWKFLGVCIFSCCDYSFMSSFGLYGSATTIWFFSV